MLVDEQTYAPGQAREVKLKPSQAMRIGAAMRPQARLCGFDYKTGGSCALYAMCEGFGLNPSLNMSGSSYYYDLSRKIIGPFADVVVRFSDLMGYTREQIAEWLESRGL